ncbi:helix-turn-helix transcriptional regulator [Priestia filamentosa]|uniref:helix-turn-helix domain-containing protein n=1 Tax=Priestia filamentosa TaxID=1402861 RepID=UPI00398204BE
MNQVLKREKKGTQLRKARIEMGYTLEQVAQVTGITSNYISMLERGQQTNPSDDIIIKLAHFFELDESELFISYGKIPLDARCILLDYPELTKAIGSIKNIEGYKLPVDQLLNKISLGLKRG